MRTKGLWVDCERTHRNSILYEGTGSITRSIAQGNTLR